MYACVAARHLWSLQVQPSQFPRSTDGLPVRHHFGNHSPFVCGARRQWLWIKEKSLRSSRARAITPCRKDSVTGHNSSCEVGNILEGRTLSSHNYIGKERIL